MVMMVMDKMGIDAVQCTHVITTDRFFGVITGQQGLVDGKETTDVIYDHTDVMGDKDDRHPCLMVQLFQESVKAVL